MKLKMTKKRLQQLVVLIRAGQEHLESTMPQDPIEYLRTGDNIIKQILLQKGGAI